MLTFYYHPLSPIARRVWLALLEKEIAFEAKLVDLKARANFEADYLAIHPFHHVPALVHNQLSIIESFAILDYLEAQFPQRSLTPVAPVAIAQMRMVQMVIANELMPKLPALVFKQDADRSPAADIQQQVNTVFTFLEGKLGPASYFGGDRLSLADITAGAVMPLLRRLGMTLSKYPQLNAWCDRLSARPAWQQTEPTAADLQAWQRWITVMVKRHRQRRA
ncbi:MAG: glutathione S-transferase family protein [Leptolyngbyaceae cyanobacterium]